MKGFLREFKEFASRGSVIDLAVGVIIGGAFQKIVGSLVGDIILPLVGLLMKGADLSNRFVVLGAGEYATAAEAKEAGAAVLTYGNFIGAVLDFLIMALVIFTLVKLLNRLTGRNQKEAPPAPETKTCPYCKSEVALGAVRCPFCASDLPEAGAKEA